MDYERIKKHFQYVGYLHDLTMVLNMAKLISEDLEHVDYSQDYRDRIHFVHDDLDARISLYEADDENKDPLRENFVIRNRAGMT
jgi:hypothetical protein